MDNGNILGADGEGIADALVAHGHGDGVVTYIGGRIGRIIIGSGITQIVRQIRTVAGHLCLHGIAAVHRIRRIQRDALLCIGTSSNGAGTGRSDGIAAGAVVPLMHMGLDFKGLCDRAGIVARQGDGDGRCANIGVVRDVCGIIRTLGEGGFTIRHDKCGNNAFSGMGVYLVQTLEGKLGDCLGGDGHVEADWVGVDVVAVAYDLVVHGVGLGILTGGDRLTPSYVIQAVLHGAAGCCACGNQALIAAVEGQTGNGNRGSARGICLGDGQLRTDKDDGVIAVRQRSNSDVILANVGGLGCCGFQRTGQHIITK